MGFGGGTGDSYGHSLGGYNSADGSGSYNSNTGYTSHDVGERK